MKTFNEFINEGQHFLRSIGKNDKVTGKKTFGDLCHGDWFFVKDTEGLYHADLIYGNDITDDHFHWWYTSEFENASDFEMENLKDKCMCIGVDAENGEEYEFYSNMDEFIKNTGIKADDTIKVEREKDDKEMMFINFKNSI